MKDRFIKRLWHTNKKCFIYEFAVLQTVNADGNFENTYFERDSKTLELKKLSTCQVEESHCTGLKDKNGNLIYEGDIVRTKRGHNGSKYCPLGERTYNVSFDCQMLHDGEIYEKEIIGNIYENPELLKDGE